MTSQPPYRWSRLTGLVLAVAGLVLLLVLPIHVGGDAGGSVVTCGNLFAEAGTGTGTETGSVVGRLLFEQRLDGDCADAASARWVAIVLIGLAVLLMLWPTRTAQSTRLSALALGVLVVFLASAAWFDGPPVPLGLGVAGAALATWHQILRARTIDGEADAALHRRDREP